MKTETVWMRIRVWSAAILVVISALSVISFGRWDIGAWFGIWAVLFIIVEALAIMVGSFKQEVKDEISKR